MLGLVILLMFETVLVKFDCCVRESTRVSTSSISNINSSPFRWMIKSTSSWLITVEIKLELSASSPLKSCSIIEFGNKSESVLFSKDAEFLLKIRSQFTLHLVISFELINPDINTPVSYTHLTLPTILLV